jgi:hypothetical protein
MCHLPDDVTPLIEPLEQAKCLTGIEEVDHVRCIDAK